MQVSQRFISRCLSSYARVNLPLKGNFTIFIFFIVSIRSRSRKRKAPKKSVNAPLNTQAFYGIVRFIIRSVHNTRRRSSKHPSYHNQILHRNQAITSIIGIPLLAQTCISESPLPECNWARPFDQSHKPPLAPLQKDMTLSLCSKRWNIALSPKPIHAAIITQLQYDLLWLIW